MNLIFLWLVQMVKNIFINIKKKFCVSNITHNQDETKYKLKQEQLFSYFILVAVIFFVNLSLFLKDKIGFYEILTSSVTSLIFLYLIKIQKTFILGAYSILLQTIICITVLLIEKKECYLISQVILALFPSICLLLTRSFIASFSFYVFNAIGAFWFFKPKTLQLFELQEDNPDSKMFIYLLYGNFGIGLALIIMLEILLASRQALICELTHTAKDKELLNLELSQSNIRLKDAVKIRDSTFLTVSHEVRNPINIISGSVDLALLDDPNEEFRYYLNHIKSSTELLSQMANNFLDSSKMEEYDFDIKKEFMEASIFFDKLWYTTTILTNKTNLQSEMFIAKDIPIFLKLDKERVIQIIHNLVSNAIKFTPSGYIAVICSWINPIDMIKNMDKVIMPTKPDYFRHYLGKKVKLDIFSLVNEITPINSNELSNISTIREKDETMDKSPFMKIDNFDSLIYRDFLGKYSILNNDNPKLKRRKLSLNSNGSNKGFLKIEILDSGYGIDEKNFQRIFQKFTQVDVETHKRLGSGLGLWIVNKLCTKMNGSISVNSVLKEGSIFVALIESD